MKKLVIGVFIWLCACAFGETFQKTEMCTMCGREFVTGKTNYSSYVTMYVGSEEYTVAKVTIDEKKGIVITPTGKWTYYEDKGIVEVDKFEDVYSGLGHISPDEFKVLAVEVKNFIDNCRRECQHSHKLKEVKYECLK